MPQMTIKTVWFGEGKTGTVTFEEEPETKYKVWANVPFKDALTVGAKAEATFKTEPPKGDFPETKFLVTWGGVGAPEKKFGGGGGPKQTPEQFATEKVSILASVALAQAREHHVQGTEPADVCKTATGFFKWLVHTVKANKGELL